VLEGGIATRLITVGVREASIDLAEALAVYRESPPSPSTRTDRKAPPRYRMSKQLQYGATAKTFHWLIVALLVVQFPLGWLMPDIHRGMTPGTPMMFHISVGMLILAIIALRFLWRLLHPVAPESSLSGWQRVSSEALHWVLYGVVFAMTLSGWFFASGRGWTIYFFELFPLPMLSEADSPFARAVGRWHETLGWALLVLIGLHVLAALAHIFVYRNRVMARMLPGQG
jgi:cytochrome b561